MTVHTNVLEENYLCGTKNISNVKFLYCFQDKVTVRINDTVQFYFYYGDRLKLFKKSWNKN